MTRWGEINCPSCAEQDALWEGMERALEESDAREARLEADLAKAVGALQAFHLFDALPLEVKRPDIFERMVRLPILRTLAELKGQNDG